MTESDRHPERSGGDYDPAEDPDTDAPASARRAEGDEEIPEGQAEPNRSEPPPGGPPTSSVDPPSDG